MTILDLLNKTNSHDRPAVITEVYEKNRAFFKAHYPQLDQLIETVDCPYHFDITDSFINIIHTPMAKVAHPVDLFEFASKLGEVNHNGWQNLVNFQPSFIRNSPDHQICLDKFDKSLKANFPSIAEKLDSGKTLIKTTGAEYSVLPPVAFVGIFHGLHIDKILDKVEIPKILLIEPDPLRFEVSCYFLDYQKIHERFGSLPLIIGTDITKGSFESFHSATQVSTRLWYRCLPGYDDNNIGEIIEQLRVHQHVLDGVTTSYDREKIAYNNAENNLKNGLPFLSKRPKVSKKSRFAIVASGPSAVNDYEWLKKNRNKLIIFAVHSSVKPLMKAGIRPDFQVSIESHKTDKTVESLGLIRDIPLITNYQAPKNILNKIDIPLLIAEKNHPHPYLPKVTLELTGPSTTNSAIAFALYCKPKEIYLIGVDVGYKDSQYRFVKGGIHEQNGRISKKEGIEILVDANFPEQGKVLTNPFFNKVRETVEEQARRNRDCKIINLSDGALIKGCTASSSNKVKLSKYIEKDNDIYQIVNSFRNATVDKNYNEYYTAKEELLKKFVGNLKQDLLIERFDWIKLTQKLDCCIYDGVSEAISESGCLRLTVFERLIVDLLTHWYRFILLSETPEEAEKVYQEGYRKIVNCFEELNWN